MSVPLFSVGIMFAYDIVYVIGVLVLYYTSSVRSVSCSHRGDDHLVAVSGIVASGACILTANLLIEQERPVLADDAYLLSRALRDDVSTACNASVLSRADSVAVGEVDVDVHARLYRVVGQVDFLYLRGRGSGARHEQSDACVRIGDAFFHLVHDVCRERSARLRYNLRRIGQVNACCRFVGLRESVEVASKSRYPYVWCICHDFLLSYFLCQREFPR